MTINESEKNLNANGAQEELGPNGFRVGYTENGDKVEWMPDEDDPGQEYPMIFLRNSKDIDKAYREFWDKVWWNRIQRQLKLIESQPKPLTEQQKTSRDLMLSGTKRVEEKYGLENLGLDDFEWGLLTGRMSALSWVSGAEWEESMDT